MDGDLILETVAFAATKHKHDTRKNGTPYINHPIGVANYIVNIPGILDPVVICAALLHGILDYTDTTYDELVSEFGVKVASIVKELTEDSSLTKLEQKKAEIELWDTAQLSYEARLIKLADILYNLTEHVKEPYWCPDITRGYFVWAYKVVKQLHGTNSALETALDEVYAKVIKPETDIEAALQCYYDYLATTVWY